MLFSIPVLYTHGDKSFVLTPDGELQTLSKAQTQMQFHKAGAIVCHAPYTMNKTGLDTLMPLDVLELFAFVHPTLFCSPTPPGLSKALGLEMPESFDDYPLALSAAIEALLSDLKKAKKEKKKELLSIAAVMGLQGKGWGWTPYIFDAFNTTYNPQESVNAGRALNVWDNLPEWAEEAPTPPPSHHGITEEEAREKLTELVGAYAEKRPQQLDYTATMTKIFAPNDAKNEDEITTPHLLLAEAGTGTGKTLGYLAPAQLWAEKNEGCAWISTYTRNLQRQIDSEMERLYPDPTLKSIKAAIRKGRENYLCLLNFQETAAGAALSRYPQHAVAVGLIARWIAETKDGDLSGADFHGWLPGLLGTNRTTGLSDRRGECIYAACEHYKKCFIERSIRKSAHARLVIANHALVMNQTALAEPGTILPQRYIFDEGHHLFSAADSAFAAHLTGRETHELRRWILGPEGTGRKSRAKGLKKRLEDLIAGDDIAEKMLAQTVHHARNLPADGWLQRVGETKPQGNMEHLLHLISRQVFSRASHGEKQGPYSLETQTRPLIDGLKGQAAKVQKEFSDLQKPANLLAAHLRKKLEKDGEKLDTDSRKRIESAAVSLNKRALLPLSAWIDMLKTLQRTEDQDLFTDWMEVERIDGKVFDLGLYRHWTDPMKPFAAAIRPHAKGIAITSATLKEEGHWETAFQRTGAHYLSEEPLTFFADSPFDYSQKTRVFVISDVDKKQAGQVANAYKTLFNIANGGALGLFTAIHRLKAIYKRIAPSLEQKGFSVYAQHMNDIDPGTLVDIFKEEPKSCLLGTDAIRDGVDIPGDALRLIVFDRVPWPRPTILHKARRKEFGGHAYDEAITRLKLRQAYGRLIRKDTDKGVFVLLDSGLPTRLCDAFPKGVEVERTGLKDAAEMIKKFLSS